MPTSFTHTAFATAARFYFTDGTADFGDNYSIWLNGQASNIGTVYSNGAAPLLFDTATVNISATAGSGGSTIYTTVSTVTITDLNVQDFLTADQLQCSPTMQWDSSTTSIRPRLVPILTATNLKILGYSYFENFLQLPAIFSWPDSQRQAYLGGQGSEVAPVDYVQDNFPLTVTGTTLKASQDTRRVLVPGHGVVSFAKWKWDPAYPNDAQQIFTGLHFGLGNPGTGGTGSTGGGGKPGGS